jgi:hypothetical protein
MSASKQFPPQKELTSGSTGSRRDRGAHSKRLPRTEVPLVDEGVPKVVRGGQLPGCLPSGATLDTLLTPDEFCIWQRCCRKWFSARRHGLPGVIAHSRDMVRIHPRTYLEKAMKGTR